MPVQANTPYAVRTDLANLGLPPGALQNVATGVQDAALLSASAVVDSCLQDRFVVPLTTWGQDIVRATCIIAAYDILTSRGYNPQSIADANVRQRYLDTLTWLRTETPSYLVDTSNDTGGSPSVSSSDIRGWTPRGDSTAGTAGDIQQ